MDNDKLNAALYEKISAEQDVFRDWLLTQPPKEILNHAYEYSVREDIVMAMEELNLDAGQATALLESPSPLGDIFKEFERLETGHMDTIRECIETRADDAAKMRGDQPVQAETAHKQSIKKQLAAPPVPGDKPPTKSIDRGVR